MNEGPDLKKCLDDLAEVTEALIICDQTPNLDPRVETPIAKMVISRAITLSRFVEQEYLDYLK